MSAPTATAAPSGASLRGCPVEPAGNWTVRVEAPARLSFTLINLDAGSLRRNGIAAMALRRPGLVAQVRAIDGHELQVSGVDGETAEDLEHALGVLRTLWSGPAVRVDVTRPLPAHTGFGSKTSTLLAVGHAYGLICGWEPDLRDLSMVLGRGRTSGASTGLARYGGFLVDGGHRNPPDFAASPQEYLRPSRFAPPAAPPAPTVRLDFPRWPVLVLITRGRHLGGSQELAWFQSVTPIPEQEARRTAQLVFMGLVPAVAEQDYDAFCDAVNEITFTSYFKGAQIRYQGEAVTAVLDDARRHPVIDAVGLSVTGPACFAFTRDPAAAVAWAEGLRAAGKIDDYWFTSADNTGLRSSYAP